MDKIFFRQLKMQASIGVLPHEKQHRQTIIIDLEFAIDIASAAKNDSLADTVDYAAVKNSIHAVVDRQHYQLIETLANSIAAELKQQFALQSLRLSISKPDIFADMESVGVSLSRGYQAHF